MRREPFKVEFYLFKFLFFKAILYVLKTGSTSNTKVNVSLESIENSFAALRILLVNSLEAKTKFADCGGCECKWHKCIELKQM